MLTPMRCLEHSIYEVTRSLLLYSKLIIFNSIQISTYVGFPKKFDKTMISSGRPNKNWETEVR